MSEEDKDKDKDKTQEASKEEIGDNEQEELKQYEYASFVRNEEELEFYKTPDIKKNHLLVIFGSALFLIILCIFAVTSTLSFMDKIRPIDIKNNPIRDDGIYDPSLAYYRDKDDIILAYSSVQISGEKETKININIAHRKLKGKHWQYIGNVFKGKKDLLDDTNGRISSVEGVWRYETPSIVYDPDDEGYEWKIFAYKYFWTGDVDDARKYSAIVLKTSSDIYDNSKWSKETWLFSAREGQPPKPYSGLVLLHLNRLHPSLRNVSYYAEPAAIYYDKTLLMAFSTYEHDSKTPDRIILIGSRDHGRSWLYLGDLITSKQAKKYGNYSRVDAPSLVEKDKKLYLMVSFGNKNIKHIGTHVFEFENFVRAKLKTDKDGYPIAVNYIEPPFVNKLTPLGAGSSVYHEKLPQKTGVLMSQMISEKGENKFYIYKTKQGLLSSK